MLEGHIVWIQIEVDSHLSKRKIWFAPSIIRYLPHVVHHAPRKEISELQLVTVVCAAVAGRYRAPAQNKGQL